MHSVVVCERAKSARTGRAALDTIVDRLAGRRIRAGHGARATRRPHGLPGASPSTAGAVCLAHPSPRPQGGRMTTLARLLASVAVAAAIALPRPTPAGAATDPVGQWPLQPAPEVVRGLRPPGVDLGAGPPGGRPGRAARAAGPRGAAGPDRLRRHPSPGAPVVTVAHGGTRTTYEPVATTLPRGTPVAAGDAIGSLGVVGLALLPPRLPPLGLDPGRDLPRPVAPRRRRPGAAAAAGRPALRRRRSRPCPRVAADLPVRRLDAARGCGPALAVTPAVRPAGGPAGRPCGAGRW